MTYSTTLRTSQLPSGQTMALVLLLLAKNSLLKQFYRNTLSTPIILPSLDSLTCTTFTKYDKLILKVTFIMNTLIEITSAPLQRSRENQKRKKEKLWEILILRIVKKTMFRKIKTINKMGNSKK